MNKVDVLTLSPVERKLYESRMKLKSDIATISEIQFKSGLEQGISQGKSLGLAEGISQGKSLGLAEGISQGITEGIAQGSRQKALETARILKQLGDSVQKIVQATGLTVQEVEALK